MRQQPEHQLQCALVTWLHYNVRPEVTWFAVPNGELRHPRVAQRLKAEGVQPGVADLCFMLEGGQTGWLELKAPKGGSLSHEQHGFGANAHRLGHYWAVAKSIPEAADVLKAWGVLRHGVKIR
jgi:hypothetical protein